MVTVLVFVLAGSDDVIMVLLLQQLAWRPSASHLLSADGLTECAGDLE